MSSMGDSSFSHDPLFSGDGESVRAHGAGEKLPQIPDFIITGKLGEGGMGTVWRATQLNTRREVAIKILGAGGPVSERAKRRFDREVELTSRLRHPNIARVFDAKPHRGIYYYAMELIEGVPLDDHAARQKLARREKLLLMRSICDAVQHAHQIGVIHRDLKPSNILVTADGEPHVVDFGLAKDLLEEDGGLTITREGTAPGTPAFMAPEQAGGQIDRIDTRTDVYALGVMLYRLLTNDHPHDLTGTRFQVLRRIVDAEIRRPRKASREIDADLDAILLKALAKDPRHRYFTAGDLGQDIDRYLNGQPISARAPTFSYLLRRQIARYRWYLFAGVAVLALMVAVGVSAYLRVVDANERTSLQLAASLINEGDALSISGIENRGLWREAKDRYLRARSIGEELGAPTLEANAALWAAYRRSPPPLLSFPLPAKPTGVAALADGRRVVVVLGSAIQEYDAATGRHLRRFDAHPSAITAMSVSNDSQWMAAGDEAGNVILWSLADGLLKRRAQEHQGKLRAMAFTPDGAGLLTCIADGTVQHRRTDDGELIGTIAIAPDNNGNDLKHLVVSDDGRQILICVSTSRADVWDLHTRTMIETFSGKAGTYNHSTPMAIWSRSTDVANRRLVSGDSDRITVRDKEGQLIFALFGQTRPTRMICRSFNHNHVASVVGDEIRVWDLHHRHQPHVFTAHTGAVQAACFIPKSNMIVSVGDDQMCHVWTLEELDRGFSFSPLHASVGCFSRDGRLALIAQHGQDFPELWDVAAGQPLRRFDLASNQVDAVALSPDSRTAAFEFDVGIVQVWDVERASHLATLPIENANVATLKFSADGATLAGGDSQGVLRLWSTKDWTVRKELRVEGAIRTFSFLDDRGDRIAVASGTRVSILSVAGDAARHFDVVIDEQHGGGIECLVPHPDGRRLLVGQSQPGNLVTVWDTSTGTRLDALEGHASSVQTLAVSPDGRYAISGDQNDSDLIVWDLNESRRLRKMHNRGAGFGDLKFSGLEGEILCLGLYSGYVSRWNLASARAMEQPPKQALETLREQPSQPAAVQEVGRWFLQRGARAWGVAFLEQARAAGQNVPNCAMAQARWNWQMNDPVGALKTLASAEPTDEHDAFYLRLLRSALQREADKLKE